MTRNEKMVEASERFVYLGFVLGHFISHTDLKSIRRNIGNELCFRTPLVPLFSNF